MIRFRYRSFVCEPFDEFLVVQGVSVSPGIGYPLSEYQHITTSSGVRVITERSIASIKHVYRVERSVKHAQKSLACLDGCCLGSTGRFQASVCVCWSDG